MFSKPKRLLVLLFVTLIFYFFNIVVSNFSNILWVYRNEGFFEGFNTLFVIILGFHRSILPSSFITIIVIGLLTGVLISLLLYRSELSVKNRDIGLFGGFGLFLGFLAPGCATCGLGLIGLLGLSSSLASLPLKGSEVSYLAIILIIFSIIRISTKLIKSLSCNVNIQKSKSERRLK